MTMSAAQKAALKKAQIASALARRKNRPVAGITKLSHLRAERERLHAARKAGTIKPHEEERLGELQKKLSNFRKPVQNPVRNRSESDRNKRIGLGENASAKDRRLERAKKRAESDRAKYVKTGDEHYLSKAQKTESKRSPRPTGKRSQQGSATNAGPGVNPDKVNSSPRNTGRSNLFENDKVKELKPEEIRKGDIIDLVHEVVSIKRDRTFGDFVITTNVLNSKGAVTSKGRKRLGKYDTVMLDKSSRRSGKIVSPSDGAMSVPKVGERYGQGKGNISWEVLRVHPNGDWVVIESHYGNSFGRRVRKTVYKKDFGNFWKK